MENTTYPYRPQTRPLVAGCAFFGAMAVFFAYRAVTNDRGLIINGLIHLGRDNAAIFYWIFAAIGGLLSCWRWRD